MHKLILHLYRCISRRIFRRRLQNRNFSIITDTCIGGVIYHELGLPFLSPTINLWMENVDFYKFAHNLKHYMSADLRFVPSPDPTPVAYCDDILIHFNHYKTEAEAASKWYERRKRINWDNLFLITSDRPCDREVTKDDILSLQKIPCKGRLVFSVKDISDCDYVLKYDKDPQGNYVKTYMLDKTWLGTWKWEHMFDYVYWLNTGKLKK